jgi:hypothetical protein
MYNEDWSLNGVGLLPQSSAKLCVSEWLGFVSLSQVRGVFYHFWGTAPSHEPLASFMSIWISACVVQMLVVFGNGLIEFGSLLFTTRRESILSVYDGRRAEFVFFRWTELETRTRSTLTKDVDAAWNTHYTEIDGLVTSWLGHIVLILSWKKYGGVVTAAFQFALAVARHSAYNVPL